MPEKFTEARVVQIKQALMRGTDPVLIARIEGVSANTIRRIAKGETYNHVRVVGEERIPGRAPMTIVDYHPTGQGVVTPAVYLPEVSPEVVAESERKLQILMEGGRVKEGLHKGPTADDLSDDDPIKKMAKLLGA